MRRPKHQKHIRGVTPEIQTAAQKLRQQMTPAEDYLWQALKSKQIAGLRFRRQHPIGQFILDFYCPALKLAIEVDGPIHDNQADSDQARTNKLTSHGYQVLRFTNQQVIHDRDSIIAAILEIAANKF